MQSVFVGLVLGKGEIEHITATSPIVDRRDRGRQRRLGGEITG
jgi:hypothetical protein